MTRLTGTNYETQAAAASDLGGIEISRSRLVITIGLATITYNPTVTAIVIAAGDAKAPIVAAAIENKPSPQYPASVLQGIEGGRMYLTKGAASRLVERRFEDFRNKTGDPAADIDDVVVPLAVHQRQARDGAAGRGFRRRPFRGGTAGEIRAAGARRWCRVWLNACIDKIERGLAPVKETVFLHTEPHHDDIMLGIPRAHLSSGARSQQQALLREPDVGLHRGVEPVLPFHRPEPAAVPRVGRSSHRC